MIRQSPGISPHGSLPCNAWFLWQLICVYRYGESYLQKLIIERSKSLAMLLAFIRLADLCIDFGGGVSLEWPRNCQGWHLIPLMSFVTRHNLFEALPSGCACGLVDDKGVPILK